MIRLLPLVFFASALAAQTPRDVVMERAGYLAWLKEGNNSPLAAVAQQTIGDGVSLGPDDADIPLAGVGQHRLYPAGGGLILQGPNGRLPIARGRPYRIGKYVLHLTGPHPGTVLTVYAGPPSKEPPGYYGYDPSLVFTGPLVRANPPRQVRLLASDGIETQATEVGSFLVPLGGGTSLRVRRIPIAGGDESDLEIFFQDESNGKGTYPAGRFVSLIPLPGGQFRLDFNRARNPYCAYSTVYPCPIPWRGNTVPAAIAAGERYAGGGLDVVPAETVDQ